MEIKQLYSRSTRSRYIAGAIIMESNGSILRTHRNKNYKNISCTALDDRKLSFRAKGIHTYLITRPNGWVFYKGQIQSMSTEGREACTSAINELKELGYLTIVKTKVSDGRYVYEWTIYEEPVTGKPEVVQPDTGNQSLETRIYNNKYNQEVLNNKDIINKEEFKDLTEEFNKINIEDDMDWLPDG